ncbi:MAG TPA: sigma-70 family RNA polymerase sigma factor [Planctomycetota bacterium]|nr:sigma-70 family RNA polymerase sigma factor [Planctomycetota bacterium]
MADRDAFLMLLLQNEPDLRAFIGSLVRDREAREDVFQEVALTLWQQADRYDPRRPFGAWARGVAANKVLQRRHQDKRFPIAFPPETILAVLDAFDRTEAEAPSRLEALRHCLAQLPEKARQLLALRYEQGLTVKEVAERSSRTLDAAYQALCRIRTALEDCVRRRLAAAREGA